jgi:hypothetical protein
LWWERESERLLTVIRGEGRGGWLGGGGGEDERRKKKKNKGFTDINFK